ncbi:hypothetical protein VTO73DRAFT_2306 [Trametes versicolor]
MEDWRSRIIESGSYHEICQPGHYVLLAQHVTESTQRIPNTRRNAVVTKTRYWHIEPIFDDEQLYALPPALRPKAAGFTEEQVPVPKDEKKKRKKKKEPDYIRDGDVRQQVRLRDGHCRLSGVMGVLRDRGFDFTGIEVAHIWALAHAHPEFRHGNW